ncbi:hypothetical protein CU098_000256, partial [Rhizopus stolonifer]
PVYEYHTQVRCHACQTIEPKEQWPSKLTTAVDAVLNAMSSAKQSEVQSWEEVITPCEHTLCLAQEAPKKLDHQELAHCADCDLNQNLWLCLVCGNLGCGRKQYDGSGGNNHAIEHFEKTGHGVNVKLGTITAEGTADIYCYSCDDARLDENLATHLANWGIQVAQQTKTEKSMTELQLEQNLKFDFSMTTEDGKQLEPRFGPGYTGLKNLGNSCYMASVLQSVFNIPAFQERYGKQLEDHAKVCTQADPASCWSCQLHKLADGLLSGRYSQPITNATQDGIAPGMFKALVGKGHAEFSTMRQQDAFEFFQYLYKNIQQKEHAQGPTQPTDVFDFMLEQRIQCDTCKKVRYQKDPTNSISVSVPAKPTQDGYEPVDFTELMDTFVKPEVVDGYQCPQCQTKTTAYRSVKFSTFPQVLVINPRRFAFVDWVPQKLNIPLQFPDKVNLDNYMGTGLLPGEEPLPEEEPNQEPVFNQTDLDQLQAMGFSENRCKRALMNTGHQGAEVAMAWMFEHMEDPDIDGPLEDTTAVDDSQIQTLQDMGFTAAQAKKALSETNNDTERALDWLFSHPEDQGQEGEEEQQQQQEPKRIGDTHAPFNYRLDSFISHKGTSIHCGHYVAHVFKNDDEWALFNDNKVAVTPHPPKGEAYLYFLKRQ